MSGSAQLAAACAGTCAKTLNCVKMQTKGIKINRKNRRGVGGDSCLQCMSATAKAKLFNIHATNAAKANTYRIMHTTAKKNKKKKNIMEIYCTITKNFN